MSEFRCEDPRGFFVIAFVTCPTDEVQKFAGMTVVFDLGVENLCDFEFRFVIDCYWKRWGLNTFGDQVWEYGFQH